MQLIVGTSGYSYKEWKGSFYPEDLSAKKMLGYYGERLGAVEINNTFYRLPRLPKASVLENWAGQVPEDFRFSIKASRRITHFTRMKAEAREPTEYLLSTLETLGDRLGVILFQLPPNLKKDVDRLAGFLEILPDETPAAFEFRHESWNDDEVHSLLSGRGMAPNGPRIPRRLRRQGVSEALQEFGSLAPSPMPTDGSFPSGSRVRRMKRAEIGEHRWQSR